MLILVRLVIENPVIHLFLYKLIGTGTYTITAINAFQRGCDIKYLLLIEVPAIPPCSANIAVSGS